MYFIQHCFICRLSDSTVSDNTGIEPRTLATLALVVTLYTVKKVSDFFVPSWDVTITKLSLVGNPGNNKIIPDQGGFG